MRCPKCGQEMIHISNQHICTACGIVANEFSPKSQVLAQVKKKMAAAQAVPKQEEYISPTAVATAEKPAGISTMHPREDAADQAGMSGKTLDQIAREMVNQNQTREDIGATPVPGFSVKSTPNMIPEEEGEKVIPRIEFQPEEPAVQEQSIPVRPTAVQAPGAAPLSIDGGGLFAPPGAQTGQGANAAAPSSGTATFPLEAGATGSEMVYPSHQVNPILIKIFIAVFSILVFFVIAYLLYANLSAVKGLVDNISRFLGERVFR